MAQSLPSLGHREHPRSLGHLCASCGVCGQPGAGSTVPVWALGGREGQPLATSLPAPPGGGRREAERSGRPASQPGVRRSHPGCLGVHTRPLPAFTRRPTQRSHPGPPSVHTRQLASELGRRVCPARLFLSSRRFSGQWVCSVPPGPTTVSPSSSTGSSVLCASAVNPGWRARGGPGRCSPSAPCGRLSSGALWGAMG